METVLSHLYECKGCQGFFNTAVRLRRIAEEDRKAYPTELDDRVLRQAAPIRRVRLFEYRFKLPAYVISAAAVILLAVSFAIGFMVQEDVHQKEMDAILKAPPSQIVYGMPTQWVYPAMNHQSNGGVR